MVECNTFFLLQILCAYTECEYFLFVQPYTIHLVSYLIGTFLNTILKQSSSLKHKLPNKSGHTHVNTEEIYSKSKIIKITMVTLPLLLYLNYIFADYTFTLLVNQLISSEWRDFTCSSIFSVYFLNSKPQSPTSFYIT